jgi:hypothetical protein
MLFKMQPCKRFAGGETPKTEGSELDISEGGRAGE